VLASASHVKICGLSFENLADKGNNGSTGLAIFKSSEGEDVHILSNQFRNLRLLSGSGPVQMNFTRGLEIRDNLFDTVVFGSGMRLYKNSDIQVADNRMFRLGRTGVMLIDQSGGTVSGNYISNATGIHGNGLSAYINNKDLVIRGNVIVGAVRPVTLGEAKGDFVNNLVFQGNLLLGTPDSDGGLTSWGDAHGLKLEGNVVNGGAAAIILSASDQNVVLSGNRLGAAIRVKPMLRGGPAPAGSAALSLPQADTGYVELPLPGAADSPAALQKGLLRAARSAPAAWVEALSRTIEMGASPFTPKGCAPTTR
jgi:hypothetical protein